MSYIVARKIDQEDPAAVDRGFALPEIDTQDRHENLLDMNLDDEVLQFVLGLIAAVEDLDEGEALVVWKEIF